MFLSKFLAVSISMLTFPFLSEKGLYSTGGFLGVFTVPWVSDKFGRKWGIIYVSPLYSRASDILPPRTFSTHNI